MTDFTTRIVLYGDATWSHYVKLDAAMTAQGFTDVVTGASDGILYKMPPGEYTIDSPLGLSEIHAKAKLAANSIWLANAVFVTKSAGAHFSGLKVA